MYSLKSLELFNYALPAELIAQEPLAQRDTSRLLVVNRQRGELSHHNFYNIVDLLTDNDVLVLNQSKVFPARLFAKKSDGKDVEILLLEQKTADTWLAITSPGLRIDNELIFSRGVKGRVVYGNKESGEVMIQFSFSHQTIFAMLEDIGITPIPSYISHSLSEKELRQKYQTVFAKEVGSAAAPTAGLHFTPELLEKLQQKRVQIEYITLHVGLGTFQSLREEHFQENALHSEYVEISPETAQRLEIAKSAKKRIIAVGTTTTRALESAATSYGHIGSFSGNTSIFINPPYRFKYVDAMITNFHLPKSSLLMLVSAFSSHPNTAENFTAFSTSLIGKAYAEAIGSGYRFFSFGDAMLII